MSNRHSSLRFHLNLLLLVLLALVVPSHAQISPLFQWGFDNVFLSTKLPTCQNIPVVVKPLDVSTNNTLGTAPYYMIALVVGQTPVTTFIGTDPNNLTYEVTEPAGSQLALSVVDANGSSGGLSPNIYTVIDGQTTQCVTKHSLATPEFKIATNVTGRLSTCQPWGFTITGGVPPYIITLESPGSPNVTNATIAFGDNSFTYINRAQPNQQLLGAISDFTGRWAYGTALVNTIGSADTDCTGLVSSSGNATIIQQQEDAKKGRDHSHHTVVLVSIILSVLFIVSLSIASLLYLRKRIKQADAKFNEVIPRPLIGLGERTRSSRLSVTNILNLKECLASTPNKTFSSKQLIVTRTENQTIRPPPSFISTEITLVSNHDLEDGRPFSIGDYSSFDQISRNSSRSMYSLPMPSFAQFPLTSIRAPQSLNRQGPGERMEAINQNRRASSGGAELFYNYNEPALSDSSNVLPRSSYATG